MKITVTRKQEIEVTHARLVLGVFYEEEDMPNDYPHRKGEVWDIRVNLATGQIEDWPQDVPPRSLHMKVTYGGSYYLLDKDGNVVKKRTNDYVPKFVPGEYGDYVIMDIDANGLITNWTQHCTPGALDRFGKRNDEEDED